jgi:hypothetical protein
MPHFIYVAAAGLLQVIQSAATSSDTYYMYTVPKVIYLLWSHVVHTLACACHSVQN